LLDIHTGVSKVGNKSLTVNYQLNNLNLWFKLPLRHEFRYHAIWNTKCYISNDDADAKPSQTHLNGRVNEGENHFIDTLKRVTPYEKLTI